MKVVAFNGSARKEGNTARLIAAVFKELNKEGIETESVWLNGKPFRGCTACYQCFEKKNKRCAVEGDFVNACIEKMETADGIILASPTYFANVSAEMKALIDRAGMVGRGNEGMYRYKIGAAVVAVRRAGGMDAFNAINHFFLSSEFIIPGSSYWNIGIGRKPGDVEKDEEGMETMADLGRNMAWLLKKTV